MNNRHLLFAFLSLSFQCLHAASVQELINQNKIPAITGPSFRHVLDLSGLGIDSLLGLKNIPRIATVHVLILNNNALTTVPANAFSALSKLEALGLRNNKISIIEPGAFAGPTHLKVIRLGKNKLSVVNDGVFTNLPQLSFIGLMDNPLKKSARHKLQQQAPRARIFYVPVSTKILIGAGIIITTIALIMITTGAKEHIQEHKEDLDVQALRALKTAQTLYAAASSLEEEAQALTTTAEKQKEDWTRKKTRQATENEATTKFEEATKNIREGNQWWLIAAPWSMTEDNFRKLEEKARIEKLTNEAVYTFKVARLHLENALATTADASTYQLVQAQIALIEEKLKRNKTYEQVMQDYTKEVQQAKQLAPEQAEPESWKKEKPAA